MKYLKCLVMISLCLNGGLERTRAASLGARLTALETLLDTQVYLLRDTIQSEIAQRDILAQKVNENIEMMEQLQNELLLARTHKRTDEIGPKYIEAKAKDLNKDCTDDIVKEISEMLVRHRRGLHEEKAARKKDKEAIMNTFEQMSEDLATDISEMKAEMKVEISERTDRLEQKLDELKSIQEDLRQSASVIGSNTEEIKNISTAILQTSNNVEDQIQHTLSSQDLLQVCDTGTTNRSVNIGSCLKSHFSSIYGRLTVQARIVDGRSRNEGRIELYYDGAYRTVCVYGWSDPEAAIACRMLGYNTGTAIYGPHSGKTPVASFRPGKGDTIVVNCEGNEHHLLDCYYSTPLCSHLYDVGVRCS